MTSKVIIIGGGIIGLSTAYELLLQCRASDVTILEAGPIAGRGASWANGSMVHPSQAWPWTEASAGMDARHIAIKSYDIAARSSEILRARFDAFGIKARHRKSGSLKLYSSRTELGSALETYQNLVEMGLRLSLLSPSEVEAAIGHDLPGERVYAGLHFPDDHTGPARLYCQHLMREIKNMGGSIRLNSPVASIEDIKADIIIVCAGSGSGALLSDPNLFTARGYSRTYHFSRRGDELPPMPIMDDRAHMAVMAIGDHLRVTGGADLGEARNPDIYDQMQAYIMQLLPHLAADILAAPKEDWSALRPMSRTGPKIGKVSKGIWANTGHGHMGWTLCAGAAEVLVAEILA